MKTSDELVTSRESSDASGGSRSSAQSIRDEIIDGLHKMGSNVKILKQGVHKIYEDLKPVPTYASPTKKGQQNKQTVSAADDENEVAKEAVEDLDEENPYETLSVKENNNVINASSDYYDIKNDFRATFFGIAKDEDTSSQSSDNTSEDGGDVTPTELRPEILIEVENKEEIVEEVEKREKSPVDHKLAGNGRTAAEDSGGKYLGFFSSHSLKMREKFISFAQLVLLSLYIFGGKFVYFLLLFFEN